MTTPEIKQILETLELVRAIKEILADQDAYLPVISALGGAFIGAVSTFIPTLIVSRHQECKERKSVALQIYAEVKAILEVVEHRKYIDGLKHMASLDAKERAQHNGYKVEFPDDRFIIYKANLSRLGTLDSQIQVLVVEFYQLLEALVQDMKPGGLLNSNQATAAVFEEAIKLAERAKAIGQLITGRIEKKYSLSKSVSYDNV